ncbi:non-ribosomal peptide synthetase [Corynebacterium bovis]|uniref:non-ribosomal peptide synthetase n=1 Tax=Corynebacterium bovis TaxID=36808 RepID=UPI0018E10025|nr:non-ribosomal peptide synthetase [Corynebacterium bovis]QQC46968.1 non-ribosomal peptide synthetase [Corynebacterium bovis]
MYRTGDLAVRAADGTVTCTGRIDDQFKIRGLRVEPGDIEAAFRADGRVAAAVAVPVAGRRDTLAAGVVPAAGAFTDADLEELRRGVARVLPRYLVPQRVVALAALPVTPNGKTDRRQAARDVAAALEAGGGVAGTAAAATVATGGAAPAATAPVDAAAAPDDPALAALVTALTAVLDPGSGVPTAEDSVLGLGGDSIGALEIVARLRDAGWTVTPRDVLDAPTLAALAATMRRTGAGPTGPTGPTTEQHAPPPPPPTPTPRRRRPAPRGTARTRPESRRPAASPRVASPASSSRSRRRRCSPRPCCSPSRRRPSAGSPGWWSGSSTSTPPCARGP